MRPDERAKSERLMLIRHGEGRANVDGVIAGLSGCAGLTELGRLQVHALSARWAQTGFRPDVLVSSPVRRARETAEILAASMPGLGVVEDCALCEMHNGEADGLTWQEYDAKYERFNVIAEPSRPFAPGAESWADVMARIRKCMGELASQHIGKTAVVVTHSGFVIATVLGLLAVQSSTDRATLDPWYTSISCWRRGNKRWSLECFNDTAHLDNLSNQMLAPDPTTI